MCGIVGIFNIKSQSQELRNKALRMAQKIRHRGPDWSGIYVGGSAILAHERLSIVDPESGGQPLYSPDGKQILAVNGEIYNIGKPVPATPASMLSVQDRTVKSSSHYIRIKAFISSKN